MLKEKLERDKANLLSFYKSSDLFSGQILEAFKEVERERFVLDKYKNYAYADSPLPLIEGATISAPTMSLLLCKYAKIQAGDRVLEIGTGSGYQAALLAHIVVAERGGGVYSVEINEKLHNYAKKKLKQTPYYDHITLAQGDGTKGWPGKAMFRKIIVTATGSEAPPPLLRQLEKGGILVIPLEKDGIEWLTRIKKTSSGIKREHLEAVRFVPLKGAFGKES